MQTTYDNLIETIETITNHAVEYETSHVDAGDNYAHCVPDACAYNNAAKRLANFMQAHDIQTDCDAEEILEYVIGLDLFEMRRGSVYGCYSSVFYDTDYRDPPSDNFELCGFSVDEIETQIDISSLPESPFIEGLLQKVERDNRLCIRYRKGDDRLLSYETTDASWHAVITIENIRDAIEWLNIRDAI